MRRAVGDIAAVSKARYDARNLRAGAARAKGVVGVGKVSGTSAPLLMSRYRIEAVIGEGAFGRVDRAFDTSLKRPVAIKTLKRSHATDDLSHFNEVEFRFAREAEAGARVGSHANLVTVYDQIKDDADRPLHLVLQFVPGGTIAERLASQGALPIRDALRLTADIARGLQAAHDVGIVHRDIKPANIFIAADGRALVGDFGIAQLDDLSARTAMTNGHPGTPGYMSPEQETMRGYLRPTSDQYSVGLVLFEMLHGKRYKRFSDQKTAEFLDALPSPVAALIARMAAIEPNDRFPDMASVVRAIERIEQALGEDSIEPSASPGPATVLVAPYRKAPVRPSAGTPFLVARDSSPSPATPDTPVRFPSTGSASPATQSGAYHYAARDRDAPYPVVEATSDHKSAAATPQSNERWERRAAGGAIPDPSPPLAYTMGTGRRPRRMVATIAAIGALVMVLTAGGLVAASRMNASSGVLATATSAVGSGRPSNEAIIAASTLPTAVTIAPPPATSAPTATTAAPTATVAATRQPTATPSPTVIPTAIPPTAVPAPTLGVFGVGTTNRGDLETLSPADAVNTFTVGQEVFAYINYDGARAGADTFTMTLVVNGSAQPPQTVSLQKSGGFVTVSLGKLAAGTYRIEVRHGDALLPNQPTFQVTAPAATPVPVAPRAYPTASGQQSPAQQPISQPKAPTCAPGTC